MGSTRTFRGLFLVTISFPFYSDVFIAYFFLLRSLFFLAEDDIMVQFSIWERGDIGLEQLSDHLKLSLRHALCDLLAEYYLLTAPLSEVPEKYRRSQIARPRSCSESRLERTLIPKSPTAGSCERPSKRRLDFGNQSGFRGRRVSVGGHRRTSSTGNSPSSGSSGSYLLTSYGFQTNLMIRREINGIRVTVEDHNQKARYAIECALSVYVISSF